MKHADRRTGRWIQSVLLYAVSAEKLRMQTVKFDAQRKNEAEDEILKPMTLSLA